MVWLYFVSIFSWQVIKKPKVSENTSVLLRGTPQQVACSGTLECCRVSKYWKLAFPLGDASWKVSAGRQQHSGSGSVSAPYNGIQRNCMAFPMMGPDLPDHHLYHGHYLTRSTVNLFVQHPALSSLLPHFLHFLLFSGLCVKGKN